VAPLMTLPTTSSSAMALSSAIDAPAAARPIDHGVTPARTAPAL
jgi:hypothetical protein